VKPAGVGTTLRSPPSCLLGELLRNSPAFRSSLIAKACVQKKIRLSYVARDTRIVHVPRWRLEDRMIGEWVRDSTDTPRVQQLVNSDMCLVGTIVPAAQEASLPIDCKASDLRPFRLSAACAKKERSSLLHFIGGQRGRLQRYKPTSCETVRCGPSSGLLTHNVLATAACTLFSKLQICIVWRVSEHEGFRTLGVQHRAHGSVALHAQTARSYDTQTSFLISLTCAVTVTSRC
jgi:hypothetical protein